MLLPTSRWPTLFLIFHPCHLCCASTCVWQQGDGWSHWLACNSEVTGTVFPWWPCLVLNCSLPLFSFFFSLGLWQKRLESEQTNLEHQILKLWTNRAAVGIGGFFALELPSQVTDSIHIQLSALLWYTACCFLIKSLLKDCESHTNESDLADAWVPELLTRCLKSFVLK